MGYKGNEKYKDTIFRYLFSEEKNFVQLYYDITGQMLKEEDLEFYNTESVVVKQLRNDVAFITKDHRLIIMVEHQSTLNENMPLRCLLYYAELLKVHIKQNELNIFANKAVDIPKPEFHVVYNGVDTLTYKKLYLKANLGGDDKVINIKVKIMDITYPNLPKKVKKRKDVLNGYSYLIDRIRYYQNTKKLPLEEAIQKGKEDTLKEGYLLEYLNRKEFETMITKVLSIEEEFQLIRLEERQETEKKVRQEEKIETAKEMLADGESIEKIIKYTKLSLEKVQEIQKQLVH